MLIIIHTISGSLPHSLPIKRRKNHGINFGMKASLAQDAGVPAATFSPRAQRLRTRPTDHHLRHRRRCTLPVNRGVRAVVHPQGLLLLRHGSHHEMKTDVIRHEGHEAHHDFRVHIHLGGSGGRRVGASTSEDDTAERTTTNSHSGPGPTKAIFAARTSQPTP